jgi:hypothetical protein
MGPINMEWIRQNGEGWSMGRIDCRGTGLGMYGDELGVPPMKSEDWNRFGEWLWSFETKELWTLDMLVAEYEKNNPNIIWLKNELYN